jgi:tetratricopeptide (TPR) repeat protein
MEIEGETPPLQALLAWVHATRVRAGVAPDRSPLDTAATVATALLKSPVDAHYGHALMGFICYERGDIAAAIRHLLIALEQDPNDSDALFYLGISYQASGQHAAGEAVAARLMADDPLAPMTVMFAASTTWWSNRAAEGIALAERGVATDPGNLIGRWVLGYTCALAGDAAAAGRQAQYLADHAPMMPYTGQVLALVHGLNGRPDLARAALKDVVALDAHHRFHLAESFAMAGEPERAFELLEDAVHNGFHPTAFIAEYCPFFASLRGTPRFDAIVTEARRRTSEFTAAKVTP